MKEKRKFVTAQRVVTTGNDGSDQGGKGEFMPNRMFNLEQ